MIKHIIKFAKYAFIVVFVYIVFYTLYALKMMSKIVDIHFLCIIGLLAIFLYWVTVGVLSPKKLPFWKMHSRIKILLTGIVVVSIIVGVFIATEIYFLERDPQEVFYTNFQHLYRGFTTVHPFTDGALAKIKQNL